MEEVIKKAFEKDKIDAALIISERLDGYDYTLFTKDSEIKNISPFHPVMKMNAAKIVSTLTKENDSQKRFLFILKPCEVRATIELKKLNQVNLDNSILISYTCPGVFEFKEGNNFKDVEKFLSNFKNGIIDESLRESCKTCEYFSGEGADIVFDLFNNSYVALNPKGEEFLNDIGISFEKELKQNKNSEKIKEIRKNKAYELYKNFSAEFKDENKLIEYFDSCIKCNGCRYVCPICYCRQCFFESESFKYYPDSIKRKFEIKSALRLPTDKYLFHLGRVSHMAVSCVACGMCEDVCPMDIKVSQFFKYMGKNIQNTFGYIPGINREEPLPLLTYKEDEFNEVED